MKNVYVRRMCISFAISALCGLLVNLVIDIILNALVDKPFVGMSPEFVAYFPTSAMAAYVNVLIYGAIGAVFAGMTFLFDIDRIGFVWQCLLYYLSTGVVMAFIMIFLWHLNRYPEALWFTIAGYILSYVIVTLAVIRNARNNIAAINESIGKVK